MILRNKNIIVHICIAHRILVQMLISCKIKFHELIIENTEERIKDQNKLLFKLWVLILMKFGYYPMKDYKFIFN